MVKKIKDGDFGVSADGKTVTGPGEFTINLTKCAPGWSNTEGLTDTEIKIGLSIAKSGTLADYGNIGRGMDVLWACQNDVEGGFKDSTGKSRKLVMITKLRDRSLRLPAADLDPAGRDRRAFGQVLQLRLGPGRRHLQGTGGEAR